MESYWEEASTIPDLHLAFKTVGRKHECPIELPYRHASQTFGSVQQGFDGLKTFARQGALDMVEGSHHSIAGKFRIDC